MTAAIHGSPHSVRSGDRAGTHTHKLQPKVGGYSPSPAGPACPGSCVQNSLQRAASADTAAS